LRTWPTYDAEDCILIGIPRALVPIVAGLFKKLEQPYEWATEEDWKKGYQFAIEIERCLNLGACTKDLLAVQREHALLLALHLGLHQMPEAQREGLFPTLGTAVTALLAADVGGALQEEKHVAKFEPFVRELATMLGAIE